MISEPEMEDTGDPGAPLDLVSHTDRPPLLGRFTAKPWMWALGAVVVTSAVWAGVLKGTGYGQTAQPDLHGYHIDGSNPCTNLNLQPLAGSLAATGFVQSTPVITRTDVLDHASCELIGMAGGSRGWRTTYTMSVTVDLHKKTDPGTEFDARSRAEMAVPGGDQGLVFSYMDDHEVTTHPAGIGDRANMTTGVYRQSLAVRHGGAVFSLTLFGFSERDNTNGDRSMLLPPIAKTSAFRKDLVPTVRSLMDALSQPPSP